ncbi:hypothetical protein C8F04DRAFT_1247897 [Mycena alexandri]|uniref:Transmembrane protein n=1 Tax=Mycena alexandri TaxID=1745969 RepID=A0AAD6THS4_9AGAR|nr:hypothetical protein C8F04DRAFT_1247897 [Mycena alexandri]
MPCRPLARTLARTRVTRCYSALPKLQKATPVNETLHLLEATAEIVSQVLADDARQLGLYSDILSTALADLRSPHPRPARLVVYGTDRAGAQTLISALLQEPFSSDAEKARTVRERWDTAPPDQTSLTIEYGTPATEDLLRLPLAFLNQFPVPLQIVETTDPALLHTADIPVIVTRLDELHTLTITRPDALVVLNIEEVTDSQPRASTSRSPTPTKVLFVRPSQALSAQIGIDTSQAAVIREHTTNFVASGMPTLIQSLGDILHSLQSTSALRNRTALAQIQSALAACRAAVQDARGELDRIAGNVSDMSAAIEEERVKAQREVFGLPNDHAVDRALEDATTLMKYKIDHMKWRRQLVSIDETTTYITATVNRVWCIGLEKQLLFHAGRLEHMQKMFTERAFALLAPSNTRKLHSPVLHNALRQLTTAPAFPVQPTTLVQPLSARSAVVLGAPTAELHVAGQRALFGLGTSAAAGMTISWTGYLGYFMNAHSLMGSIMLEPGTAVATGMLISTIGIYWSSRKWNKARARWWEDFMRVAGGLKQDITETLDHTMENQVLVVARTGCSELSKRLGERKSELDRLQERLDALSTAAGQPQQRK